MDGLTDDVKSSGAADDQVSFQSLIDLTEERLKEKLSLLTDPEMLALEAQQSDAVNRDLPSSMLTSDEHCSPTSKDHIETSTTANTHAVSFSERIGTNALGSMYPDGIVDNHDTDGLNKKETDSHDRDGLNKNETDSLNKKESPDDRKGSPDDIVPVTQSNNVRTDESLVKEAEGATIRSQTENKRDYLYADASAGVSSKQASGENVNQEIVYTMDADSELCQVPNNDDINGNISDCFVTRQSDKIMDHFDCNKALNGRTDRLELNTGDLVNRDSGVDLGQGERNIDVQDIQNKMADANNEMSENSELQRDCRNDSLISYSTAIERGNVNLPPLDANQSKFEHKHNDEPENHKTHDFPNKDLFKNNPDCLGDGNFQQEHLTSAEAGAQKGIQIESTLHSSDGTLPRTIQPLCEQMNDSGLFEKSHEKAYDLHGYPKEKEDDSLSCISSVSVTGAVTSDNEKLVEFTDERVENRVGTIEKTESEATNTGNNLLKIGNVSSVNLEKHERHLVNEEESVKISDCSKDTDIPVHEEMDVPISPGTQIDTMSDKDGPGPLMISNVISLMDHEGTLGETTTAIETYTDNLARGESNSGLSIAVSKPSSNTSKAIDALQDMCSSVPMPVAKIIPQDLHSNSLLNNAPGKIAGKPDDHTVIMNVDHVSEASVSDLPVISDVYSIKEEPKGVYGEYSLAEGPTQVRKNVVSNSNFKPTEGATVSNSETEINDEVIQRNKTDHPKVNDSASHTSETDPSKKQHVLPIRNTNDKITNMPTCIKIVEGNFQYPTTTRIIPLSPGMMVKTTSASSLKKQVYLESQDNHSLPTLAPKTSFTNELNDMKMEPLSIQTVGVAKITELIARKNPIPTYKPPAVPENLKSLIKVQQQFPCYECGDTFLLKKSLHDHLSRRSMNINFKCETCRKNVIFTNKCQMLSHLRSHLNIHKTQAVPIHIKSDSIEISTFYDELCQLARTNKKFKFFDDTTNVEDMPYPCCLFCNYKFKSSVDRKSHYLDSTKPKSITYCDACPMYLHNTCSMQAHKLIHEIQSPDKPPKTLICPECGDCFPFDKNAAFLWHLKMHCFHLSRYGSFPCKKCKRTVSSLHAGRYHLLSSLTQYYKCEQCPMALRSVKNLYAHFNLKHALDSPVDDFGRSMPRAKIIYRCHYCDTLIDDREFLETHIESHITEIKALAKYTFHCLQCGQFFHERVDLMNHASVSHKTVVKRISYCTFCQKDMGNMLDYVLHVLMKHICGPNTAAVKFCDYCGLVCANEQWLQSHTCLMKICVYGDHTATSKKYTNCPQQSTKGVAKEAIQKHATIMQKPSPTSKGFSKEKKPPNEKTSEIGFHSTCRACGSTFNDEVVFSRHIESHRDANVFICITCGDYSFKTFNEVQKHEVACAAKVQVEKSIYKTPRKRAASKKESPTKIKITRSENDEFSVKLVPAPRGEILPPAVEHKCDQCEAAFTRKTKLEEHKKSDHGLHPCHLCGLMHDSRLTLKKHLILSHEGKKMRYNCFVCKNRKIDRYFTERSKLEKHLRQKHRLKQWDSSRIVPELPGLEGKGISPEPVKRKLESDSESSQENSLKKPKMGDSCTFKCAKCLFTCDSRDDFLLHIMEHNDPASVQCLECGLCFAVLPSLRKHLFMVHKVRDFEAYCTTNKIEEPKEVDKERTTGHDTAANVDERSDEDERSDANPLECQVCYKQFDNEAGMRSHMRVHGMALIKGLRRRSGHTRNKTLSASQTSLSDNSSVKSSSKPDNISPKEKPASSKRDNISPEEKPGGSKPDNISNEEKPWSSKPENVSDRERPMNSKPDNISNEEKQGSCSPDNISNEEKPMSSKPENVSDREKPMNSKPDNISNEEKQGSCSPDDISNEEKPDSISNKELQESLSIEKSASTEQKTQKSETDNGTNNVTSVQHIESISPECSVKE